MAGWIKIYRDIEKHWIAQDMEKFGWWIDLLLLASYEDNKTLLGNSITEVKRGQVIASLRFLAERWNASKDKINAFLKLLVQDGMIIRESDKNTTLITICNYESYQDVPEDSETPLRHLQDTTETPSRQTKEIQEIQEINNTNSARTHEAKFISWDAAREREFYNSFKGRSAYLPMATAVGKSGKDVVALLDVYMATREVINRGHKDYNEFVSLFKWHIENNKIKLHEQPQQKKSKNILEMYG